MDFRELKKLRCKAVCVNTQCRVHKGAESVSQVLLPLVYHVFWVRRGCVTAMFLEPRSVLDRILTFLLLVLSLSVLKVLFSAFTI